MLNFVGSHFCGYFKNPTIFYYHFWADLCVWCNIGLNVFFYKLKTLLSSFSFPFEWFRIIEEIAALQTFLCLLLLFLSSQQLLCCRCFDFRFRLHKQKEDCRLCYLIQTMVVGCESANFFSKTENENIIISHQISGRNRSKLGRRIFARKAREEKWILWSGFDS